MKELENMSREELQDLKQKIDALLAEKQENKLLIELSYHGYKGTGKCWAAKVDSQTKKILGFVDAESVVKNDRYQGYKTFYLADGYYLLCETGSKSQDSRRYVVVENGEMTNF